MANENLITELRAIKKILAFGVFCLFCTAVSNIYYIADDMQENTERRLGWTFYDQADTLSKEQEWQQVIALSEARQKAHPRDPWGYWFAGVAHYYLEEYSESIPLFEQAARVAPDWKKTADNWIAVARKKMKEKKPVE